MKVSKMRPIEEVATKAAEILVFEDTQKIPMVEITIAVKGEQPNYSIKVPKAFLEQIYSIGFKNGYNKNNILLK